MTIETITTLRNLKERIDTEIEHCADGKQSIDWLIHYVHQHINDAIAEQERLLPLPCETCGGKGTLDNDDCGVPYTCFRCFGSGYKPVPVKAEGKKVLGLCVSAFNLRECQALIKRTNGTVHVCCAQDCPRGKSYYNGCYGVGPVSLPGSMIERDVIGETIPSGYHLSGVNYECIWHSNTNGCLCTKACPNNNKCWYPAPKTTSKGG